MPWKRDVVAGEKAVIYPTDRERSYWPAEEHRVRIAMPAPYTGELSLERNGFVSLREPSRHLAATFWGGRVRRPTAAPDAPPRDSIEIRTISFTPAGR